MSEEQKPLPPVQSSQIASPIIASTVVVAPNPNAVVSTQQPIIAQVRNGANLDSIIHKQIIVKQKE